MTDEIEKEKEVVNHLKQIKEKEKTHAFDAKTNREKIDQFHTNKHAEDWGDTKTMNELGNHFFSLMSSCKTYYSDSFQLAEDAARHYLLNRLKAPVRGEHKQIIKTLIDEWLKHISVIHGKFAQETLKSLEYAEREVWKEVDGKKGIISKTVGKIKDTTVAAADTTTRTLTGGIIKIDKSKREIKLK
jgi:hypothetical protein